jgi:chromosome segregation ATPase
VFGKSKADRFDGQNHSVTPGPGDYNPEELKRAKGAKMAAANRFNKDGVEETNICDNESARVRRNLISARTTIEEQKAKLAHMRTFKAQRDELERKIAKISEENAALRNQWDAERGTMQQEMDEMGKHLTNYEGKASDMFTELTSVKEQWNVERESMAADLWVTYSQGLDECEDMKDEIEVICGERDKLSTEWVTVQADFEVEKHTIAEQHATLEKQLSAVTAEAQDLRSKLSVSEAGKEQLKTLLQESKASKEDILRSVEDRLSCLRSQISKRTEMHTKAVDEMSEKHQNELEERIQENEHALEQLEQQKQQEHDTLLTKLQEVHAVCHTLYIIHKEGVQVLYVPCVASR